MTTTISKDPHDCHPPGSGNEGALSGEQKTIKSKGVGRRWKDMHQKKMITLRRMTQHAAIVAFDG